MNKELTARYIAEDYFNVWGYTPEYASVAKYVDDYWPKSYTDHGITYQDVQDAVIDVLIENLEGLR